MILARYSRILVQFNATLFIFLLVYLCFHARISGDDFFYLFLVKKFGAWKGMLYQYQQWSGRWTAHWIGCALLKFYKLPYFLPLFYFASFTALITSINLFVKKIAVHTISEWNKVAISINITAAFFFTSFSIGETWFWYIIVITYLWSIISALFLLYLISSGRNTPIYYIAAFIFSVYIGGAAESLSLFCIALFGGILLFAQFDIKSSYPVNKKLLLFSLIFLCTSSLITYVAPGTAIRNALLPETTFTFKLITLGKTVLTTAYFLLIKNGLIYVSILFSISFYIRPVTTISILRLTIIFASLIFIALLPTGMVMSESGPGRSLAIVSLLSLVFFLLLFSRQRLKQPELFQFIAALIGMVIILTVTFVQIPKTITFAHSYDARINYLEKLNDKHYKGIAELEKLPDPGLLYFEEISADTAHYNNQHLKSGLGLHFNVRLISSEHER
jgi:hypothetical protein